MGDPRRRRIKRGFSQGVGGDAATELSTRPKLHIGRTHEGVWALDVLECNFPGYVQGIGGIVQATLPVDLNIDRGWVSGLAPAYMTFPFELRSVVQMHMRLTAGLQSLRPRGPKART